MSWNNDMSKAPKDRNILVGGGVFYWDDGDGEIPLHEPKEVSWSIENQAWHVVHGDGTNMWVKPLHWMELPSYP